MINLMQQPIQTLGYSAAEQRVQLLYGVNMHELRLRLTATVTISGGTSDGTLVSEGVQRFLQSVRVVHDGVNIVQPLSGRDLYQLTARVSGAIQAATNLSSPGTGSTDVAVDLVIPFARRYLARPIETVWPGTVPINSELALYVTFASGVNVAGDSQGSSAFVTGGDRTTTITNVQLTVLQVYSTARVKPWYLPQITVRLSPQYTAAQSQLPILLTGANRFDSVLFRCLEGTAQDAANGINSISLVAGGGSVRFWDGVDFTMLQREDLALFPAAATAVQTGTDFAYFADNGLLGNAVDPRPLSDPQFWFNVDAPGSGAGQIRGVFLELVTRPGYTQVQN